MPSAFTQQHDTLIVVHKQSKVILAAAREFQQQFRRLPAEYAELCIVRQYEVMTLCKQSDGFGADRPIVQYGSTMRESFRNESFLELVNRHVPELAATPTVKGHITKHSPRRGNAQLLEHLGLSLPDIMLFGDWASAPNAVNYVDGQPIIARLPSLIMEFAPRLLQGQ
jgi:hypothetical protein